jgi:hypothetical protein
MRIDVRCIPEAAGWTCQVDLDDGRRTTSHAVTVSAAEFERLASGAGVPDDLVRRSFEFLLEREPRESILPRFDLPLIGRYFPEYERTIRV